MPALSSPDDVRAQASIAASQPFPRAIAPWSTREGEYPERAPLREKLLFFLRYAILAPSTYNSQPWLFRVGDDVVDVIADFARELPSMDPERRELIMSCGAAVCNLRTAAANFGYATTLTMFPAPARKDLIARVRVSPQAPIRIGYGAEVAPRRGEASCSRSRRGGGLAQFPR